MNSLLVSHSFALAQPAHDSSWSMQTVVQSPHAFEHSRAMKLAFPWHSPRSAHVLQSVELLTSSQSPGWVEHTSQATGHVTNMKLGLVVHSPAPAQAEQLELVSLQRDLQTPQLTGPLRLV